MSQEHEHDALRDEFQHLRLETEARGGIPDFGAMMEKARADAEWPPMSVVGGARSPRMHRPRRAFLIGGWATAALAAAIAGMLLVDGRGSRGEDTFERMVATYSSDVANGAWKSPTAALLDVPGMNFTRAMPAVGNPLRDFDPDDLSGRLDPAGRDS